ncbi:MAG: hypothetical protein K0R71_1604 [Bacillales bacterium]|jgi:hypothetical protein|nr:hypothetical protein [Bacillales bacterium]
MKKYVSETKIKIGIIIAISFLACYTIYVLKIVEPAENELLELITSYQENLTEEALLPSQYQFPEVQVPGYFSRDSAIDISHLISRYVYKGSKLADQDFIRYTSFVESQIQKQQVFKEYKININEVVDFDYDLNRAYMKLIVVTNKKELILGEIESSSTEEFYKVHFRKESGEWKIYWINRELF